MDVLLQEGLFLIMYWSIYGIAEKQIHTEISDLQKTPKRNIIYKNNAEE